MTDWTQTLDATHPGDCVSYRLRRAARLAGKVFDAALKPVGLRNTQFTLLAALAEEGAQSIGGLADLLATDATTLNRNLAVLVERGLVDDEDGGDDARVRKVRLTKAGRGLYRKALPRWRDAQAQVLEELGLGAWGLVRQGLREIEKACG